MVGFTLKTSRLIGTPSETAWAQMHVFDSVFLIIVLEKAAGHEDVSLAISGKQVLLRIETLVREAEKKNLDTLRQITAAVFEETKDVTISSLILGCIVGQILYLAAKQGYVFLKRKTITQKIAEAADTPVFASGFLQAADIICLASGYIIDAGFLENLAQHFVSDDVEEIKETISFSMQQGEEKARAVALIARVEKPQELPRGDEALLPSPALSLPSHVGSLLPSGFFHRMNLQRGFAPVVKHLFGGKARRVSMTVFFLLAVLFIASLVLGVRKKTQEEAQNRFNNAYEQAQQKYDEGMALSDLNPRLAAKTLTEAKDIVAKEKDQERFTELTEKIEKGLKEAFRIRIVSDAPLFFDLTLIKEGASGTTMSFVDDVMLILDRDNRAVYKVAIPTKQAQLLSGNLDGPRYEAVSPSFGFVLSKDGIDQISLTTKRANRVVEKDEEWGEIVGISSFAGNLYLLDKQSLFSGENKDRGSIYKYQGTESGNFSNRRNYLASDVRPNFTDAVSMAIDAAIWVLFADGRMSKFIQGAPQAFSISGIDVPLSSPKEMFTDDESEHLYVLDAGNSRVVVLKKDGTYTAQYQWEGIKNVTDLVVSEKEKKILLLSGSKIYAIDLK